MGEIRMTSRRTFLAATLTGCLAVLGACLGVRPARMPWEEDLTFHGNSFLWADFDESTSGQWYLLRYNEELYDRCRGHLNRPGELVMEMMKECRT